MANFLFKVPLDFSWPIGKIWEGHICPYTCEFDGERYSWESDEIKILHYAWTPVNPSPGEGFQAWEINVFDDRGENYGGYPESPVFSTLTELCEWCELHGVTYMDSQLSKEKWMEILSGKPFNLETGS